MAAPTPNAGVVLPDIQNPNESVDQRPSPTASDNPAFDSFYIECCAREKLIQTPKKFPFWTNIRSAHLLSGGCEIWYGESAYYVKLIGPPGTLAGDILWLKSDLPRYDCNLEIIENEIREIERKFMVIEETSKVKNSLEELSQLPVIVFDPEKHCLRRKNKRETRANMGIRGYRGDIQLLGRTEEGKLVFPKFKKPPPDSKPVARKPGWIQDVKRRMLSDINNILKLHSHGIVHRDLTSLTTQEPDPLVICDVRCLRGSGSVPSLSVSHSRPYEIVDGDLTNFSFANDVFALGAFLWQSCYHNLPHDSDILLNNPPPPPFHDIFLACTQKKPEDRPTLMELRAMYEAIVQPAVLPLI